jgi:hypothetical protein
VATRKPLVINTGQVQQLQAGDVLEGVITALSAGTTMASSGAVSFANSNGVSFGMNGQTMTASVAVGAGGIALSAGTQSIATGTMLFADSNGISFGMSASSRITASYTQSTNLAAAAAGTQTQTSGTLFFANSNGVTFGMSGSNTITASVAAAGGGASGVDWANLSYDDAFVNLTNVTQIFDRPFYVPFYLPYSISVERMVWEASRAATGSNAFTVTAGIYTLVNRTQASLLASASALYSHTATASVSGLRRFVLEGWPVEVSTGMAPGVYVMGMHFRSTSTVSCNYSIRGASTGTPILGYIGPGTNNVTTATSQLTSMGFQFFGKYSTTSGALPGSIADSQLSHGISGSQDRIPMWFRLGRTS